MTKIVEVTTFKQANGIGADGEWGNTLTIAGPDDLYSQPWTDCVNGIVAAEKLWHCDFVNFQRAILRVHGKGATKADPLNARAMELQGIGMVGAAPGAGGHSHVAPPETCLVALLSGGGVRFSRILYRCCLGSDVWTNDGHGIKLTQDFDSNFDGNIKAMIGGINARAGFTMLIGGPHTALTRPIKSGGSGGVENRQLTQKHTKAGKLNPTNQTSVLDLVKKLTSIGADVATIVATRYDPETAAVLALPTTKAAIRALAGAADTAATAIEGNDFGDHPKALPPAP